MWKIDSNQIWVKPFSKIYRKYVREVKEKLIKIIKLIINYKMFSSILALLQRRFLIVMSMLWNVLALTLSFAVVTTLKLLI